MQSTPISQAEINVRIHDHVDELLELWWVEQGASKPKDLELIALSLPFARGQAIRVLDLCCGPGDAGRAIQRVYPGARIDCVDWDPVLTSICAAVNQRNHIPGTLVVRDVQDDGWVQELPGDYDVVAIVNALHWFSPERAARLVTYVHGALRSRGVFVLAEPARADGPFERGFEEWKAKQPPRYRCEHWQRFWSRANELLGYDHPALWGPRAVDQIGDSMSVGGWVSLLERPGFNLIDVLWRDGDQVILGADKGAAKPRD